jgi:ribosome recycling factor
MCGFIVQSTDDKPHIITVKVTKMIKEILEETREKMESTLHHFQEELQGIRGNRASTALVDRIRVDYYGQETELRQLANISTPEPMTITIRPYDASAVQAIENAINHANIGVNPNTDQGVIRLNMPALTKERRQELTKFLGKRTEDARVAIRNIRRHANDDVKDFEKEKEISEDDAKRGLDEIQGLTDDYIAKIDEASKLKEQDILEI